MAEQEPRDTIADLQRTSLIMRQTYVSVLSETLGISAFTSQDFDFLNIISDAFMNIRERAIDARNLAKNDFDLPKSPPPPPGGERSTWVPQPGKPIVSPPISPPPESLQRDNIPNKIGTGIIDNGYGSPIAAPTPDELASDDGRSDNGEADADALDAEVRRGASQAPPVL